MASYNINGRCEDCRYSDEYGRNCKHGLLFPVKVFMLYGDMSKCPNFDKKTSKQIEQQLDKKYNP